MSIQIEGHQKVFCYKDDVDDAAWTKLISSNFKDMRTGATPTASKFTEVSILNLGPTKLYISLGHDPVVNTGADEAVNAGLLRAQAIEIAAGAFLHLELGGIGIDELNIRTSDHETKGIVQIHGILAFN